MHRTASDQQATASARSNTRRASTILWLIFAVLTAPYALMIAYLAKDINPLVIAFATTIGIGSLGAIVGWNVSSAIRYLWKGAPAGSILTPLCSSILLICYYATFGIRLATQG